MKNKKGFTLVELLAVIVILGVLLVIAVPAISNVQEDAKKKAAIDNALTVLKGFESCDIATETPCTDASEYVNMTGVTVTRSGEGFSKFVVVFKGYTVSYSPASGSKSVATLRSALQALNKSNFNSSKVASIS